MMNVFFYEAFDEEVKLLKQHLPSNIYAEFTWKTIQEHGTPDPPATLISIGTQSVIPLEWAKKLTGILHRSTDYHYIAAFLDKCKKDLPCGYLPLYCSRAVAEQALLLWLSLLRKLPQQMECFTSFRQDGLTGLQCKNKTLLVVGVGNIGHEVVQIGHGLGMKVFGVDIFRRHFFEVSYVTLDKGLSQADIIVCAMNLTSENRGYFNYSVLRKAKPGAIFINVSRGELSPSADLLRLLDENHLGGVALDVCNNEQELATCQRSGKSSDNPEVQAALTLAKRPNVILTPHNAFNTHEAIALKALHSMEQINHFSDYGTFYWPAPPR